MATPDFLVIGDLQAKVGNKTVLGLFNDGNTGTLTAPELLVADDVMAQAEHEAYSRLLRAYSKAQVILLANDDPAMKGHVAWVALEFASERRQEFAREEGGGAFKWQYDRAIKYFDAISKGQQRSAGESVAGTTEQIGGGELQPAVPTGGSRFVFAPDNGNPTGHGGF
ncbi:MAG: hypothetical protein U9Q07_04200 [Planctomycetota bacterium]|nr:hypothetical protein [Planctomycetota bacterium]